MFLALLMTCRHLAWRRYEESHLSSQFGKAELDSASVCTHSSCWPMKAPGCQESWVLKPGERSTSPGQQALVIWEPMKLSSVVAHLLGRDVFSPINSPRRRWWYVYHSKDCLHFIEQHIIMKTACLIANLIAEISSSSTTTNYICFKLRDPLQVFANYHNRNGLFEFSKSSFFRMLTFGLEEH